MKFYYALPPALIGLSVALVTQQHAVALSSSEVSKIAKQITVLIDSKNSPGSGIIIKHSGNTYTVLTAAHVVETADKYEIFTSDGKHYPLNYSTMKKLPNVDLAVVQFTSNQSYTVAKIGNSDIATEGTTAYVAGFPKATAAISRSIYNFTNGRITANASKALRNGYALVYSNNTLPGMSGGPVLNDKGELVGVHGRADTAENTKASDINPNILVKTGFNLGIPINTFLRLSARTGVDVAVRPPRSVPTTSPKADNFYIQGVDKVKKGNFQGAIVQDFGQSNDLYPVFSGVCRDPWVTGAVSQVTGRTPRGQDDRGECNIRLYGNGHWSSYEDLVEKVKDAKVSFTPGVCRDPWVTKAVSQVTGRPPKGYGEVKECDMYLYGNGYWSDYPDLVSKVRATLRQS